MKFSIITPCRNAARRLPETIESILGQTAVKSGAVELEYIIIDGASTDETAEVVAKYPGVSFRSEPDSGLYDAVAKGLSSATGDVVAYLNAGDSYHPRAFEVLQEVFSRPEVDWVTGYAILINDKSQVMASWKPTRYRRAFVQMGCYCSDYSKVGIQQESTFWSRRLNSLIPFDELRKFRLAGDYFLWLTFSQHAPLHSVFSHLGAFRVHAGQLSEDIAAYRAEIQPLLRKANFREQLTAYWEYQCHPALRNWLWRFTLPYDGAKLFDYDTRGHAWRSR
jgi:glycosyltransferase involved in cell wall biosynthesis